jgi:hypothetical protein
MNVVPIPNRIYKLFGIAARRSRSRVRRLARKNFPTSQGTYAPGSGTMLEETFEASFFLEFRLFL